MTSYLQIHRPMRIRTPLGPETLLLEGLAGYEAVSEPFEFQVELAALKGMAIPFEEVLAQPVTIEVPLPDALGMRYFHGIVSELFERDSDKTFTRFEAKIVPRFWLWTQRSQSRIFQQKSVPEILAVVLDGLDVRQELSGVYPSRDYCVQYQESDFAFASRLMEEEGIFYYFIHSADKHEMVLADSVVNLPPVGSTPVAVYGQIEDAPPQPMQVTAWTKGQRVCPVKHTLWDYSFELAGQNLEAVRCVPSPAKIGTVDHKLDVGGDSLEVYEYPGGYAKWFDGVAPGGGDRAADLTNIFQENQRSVRLRAEASAVRSISIEGQGNCENFSAGSKFTLLRHPNADGEYYLVRVMHEARCNTPYRSGGDSPETGYRNRFECLPMTMAYHPPRRISKPTIPGPQTATVVGHQGQSSFLDKYGRVKVQFHWDRQGTNDGSSSCWVRVGQVWAGARWGAFFWPRIGHEVIVAFEDGDPDQPLIVGNVYNGKNMPPLAMPDNSAACGIKSCSVGGDPTSHYNCVIFHDTPNDEHLQVHSEKHETFTTEAVRFNRTAGGKIEVHGNLLGSGLGGGEAEDAETSGKAAPSPGFLPGLETTVLTTADSGRGGGILDWFSGVGSLAGWNIGKAIDAFLPGSQSYTKGTVVAANLLGDSMSHTLAGAYVQLVVDVESQAEQLGAISSISKFVAPVMALLSGCGGVNYATLGPSNTLVYGGDNLSVVRGGADLTYHSDYFWNPSSNDGPLAKVVPVLFLAATGVATAMDIMALVGAKTGSSGSTEYPAWATLATTSLVSQMLAFLNLLERKSALLQMAQEEATAAASAKTKAQQYFKDIADLKKFVTSETGNALRRAKSAITKVTATDGRKLQGTSLYRSLQEDYTIHAQNIDLTARNPQGATGPTTVDISSFGDDDDYNGAIHLTAPIIAVASGDDLGVFVNQTGEESGRVSLINHLDGMITLSQGMHEEDPLLVLSGPPPKIELTAGGASLTMGEDGITLQFGDSKITLAKNGVTVSCTPKNTIQVDAQCIQLQVGSPNSQVYLDSKRYDLNSPTVEIDANNQYQLTCCNFTEDATGKVTRSASLTQIN